MIYNPYPQVDLPFGNDNKLFHDLFESIMRVNERFITYKVQSSENKFGYQPHLERVFAYELYRQWGNTIESKRCSLILNAEINKTINCNNITYTEDEKPTSVKEVTLYPDIVLHKSQEDDESQSLICEMKRYDYLCGKAIFCDLYKITQYMMENTFPNCQKPFQYGIFLIIGGRLSIIEKVKSDTSISIGSLTDPLTFGDFITKYNDLLTKIVCVSYDGTILEYELLSELIKQNVQKKTKK